MPLGRTTPKATLGGLPRPNRQETPPWFKTLKPSHAKAFSRDSYMVKEPEENSSQNIPMISPQTAPAISPEHLGSWQQVPT